jgi:hypothetical protein
MFGFTSQVLATRPIPDKCQSQVWTAACQGGKGFEQFLDAFRSIQSPHEQHQFGLVVNSQLRARGTPVPQVKHARIAAIPDRPDLTGRNTHLDGSLAQMLAFGYDECCPLHR